MILIFSTEFDESTFSVIKWLRRFKQQFIRVNTISDLFPLTDTIFAKQSKFSIWFRRTHGYELPVIEETEQDMQEKLSQAVIDETKNYNEYIFHLLKANKCISNPVKGNINKLTTLEFAASAGLSIPEFLITTSKQTLNNFLLTHKRVITKPIFNIAPFNYQGQRYLPYTKIFDEEAAGMLPDSFFASLFQEYIEKEFEIRSFFFYDEFFSMAILSQQNAQTEIDFRNYDFDHPNRFLPYKLPNEIELKLKDLMNKLELNSGSVDIIRAKNGLFYFLEVNPVGQFGMVSIPCNYNLEKIIALKLIENERNNQ